MPEVDIRPEANHPELDEPRELERQKLELAPRAPSTWQRLVPFAVRDDAILSAIESYLDRPETHARYDEHEATEVYPAEILSDLRELGLAEIFSCTGDPIRSTPFHMCALNDMAARRDTSVAVTLSVNVLGLLPAYLAASEEQLAGMDARIRDGLFASLMLSELPHGSNLLRNDARAERGTLNAAGEFEPSPDGEPCTHYRLSGDKHLINGATKHGLLFVCFRTRSSEPHDAQSTIREPMKTRGDFTLFWLDRGQGMRPLPRWHTLPARAADISGLRFDNCIVSADRIIGREHGGLGVVHKTLMLSRGGVASLAAGCLARARDLACTYVRERNVYGKSIAHLGAVSDHLMKLEALDLLVSAIAVKAAMLLNSLGLAAAHYTCVAKVMACALAEEGVFHGQKILGARSLVRELPYERVVRDITLFGVFDGTSHVMLEELSSKLGLEARSGSAEGPGGSWLEALKEQYAKPPTAVKDTTREFRRNLTASLVPYLNELNKIEGQLDLSPLITTVEALMTLVRSMQDQETWKSDQGARIGASELFAQLEVLVATVELADVTRREALGLPPLEDERDSDRLAYEYAITWLGSRVVAGIRQQLLRSDMPAEEREAPLAALERAEADLLRGHDQLRRSYAEVLCARG